MNSPQPNTPRRFPGPAGALPPPSEVDKHGKRPSDESFAANGGASIVHGNAGVRFGKSPEVIARGMLEAAVDFEGGPWATLGRTHPAYAKMCMQLIDIKRRQSADKVPLTAVVVTKLSKGDTNARATMMDPTGSILGSIHAKAIVEYDGILTPGCAILLQAVSVLMPSPRNIYLNITSDNIVQVFGVDGKVSDQKPLRVVPMPQRPPAPAQSVPVATDRGAQSREYASAGKPNAVLRRTNESSDASNVTSGANGAGGGLGVHGQLQGRTLAAAPQRVPTAEVRSQQVPMRQPLPTQQAHNQHTQQQLQQQQSPHYAQQQQQQPQSARMQAVGATSAPPPAGTVHAQSPANPQCDLQPFSPLNRTLPSLSPGSPIPPARVPVSGMQPQSPLDARPKPTNIYKTASTQQQQPQHQQQQQQQQPATHIAGAIVSPTIGNLAGPTLRFTTAVSASIAPTHCDTKGVLKAAPALSNNPYRTQPPAQRAPLATIAPPSNVRNAAAVTGLSGQSAVVVEAKAVLTAPLTTVKTVGRTLNPWSAPAAGAVSVNPPPPTVSSLVSSVKAPAPCNTAEDDFDEEGDQLFEGLDASIFDAFGDGDGAPDAKRQRLL